MKRNAIISLCLATVLGLVGPTWGGILGYWPLDEGTGGQVLDASGKGHNGGLNGATWTTPGWDGRKSCLLFNGTNARVEVPTPMTCGFPPPRSTPWRPGSIGRACQATGPAL